MADDSVPVSGAQRTYARVILIAPLVFALLIFGWIGTDLALDEGGDGGLPLWPLLLLTLLFQFQGWWTQKLWPNRLTDHGGGLKARQTRWAADAGFPTRSVIVLDLAAMGLGAAGLLLLAVGVADFIFNDMTLTVG